MTNNNKSVNTKKSIAEMENECKVFNEQMKPINEWRKEERAKRKNIAQSSQYENSVCPICGKEIPDRECCNGEPLVKTFVCSDCDKRYVFPFRLLTIGVSEKEIEQIAQSYYNLYLNAELNIEFSNKVKSLIANDSNVA